MIRIKQDSPLWRLLFTALRAPVARFMRRIGVNTPSTAQQVGGAWGIDALPSGLGHLPIGSPVALLWQGSAADTSWLHDLLADTLAHSPVFLLAENETWVDHLLQHAPLHQAYTKGQLICWLMRADRSGGGGEAGMKPVFAELAQVGLKPSHALFLLGSSRMHFGASVARVQEWGKQIQNWCRGRTQPVVLGFIGYEDVQDVVSPLHSVSEVFQHIATLGHEATKPFLFVDRWNALDGPVFETRYGLNYAADSLRLTYDGSQARGPSLRLVEATDQYEVVCTQAAISRQRGVPASWTIVNEFDDLMVATQAAIAATVLIDAGPSANLDAVLRLVHRLRMHHPRTLKIVVRETHEKLRANVEQALLHLGASTVVYREIGFARLVRLIDEMSTETFLRSVNPDYDVALGGFMPEAVRGYLPVPVFCDRVQAMLDRTSHMGLTHSFLRLSMQAHIAHLDAILACRAHRDGDVLTADQNALYVFMFACAESDVEPALARLFTVPPTELFAFQTFDCSLEGMRGMLRALRDAERNGVPDYSVNLSPPAVLVSAASGPAPAVLAQQLPGLQHEAAVPKPVKTRLTVHASPISRGAVADVVMVKAGESHVA